LVSTAKKGAPRPKANANLAKSGKPGRPKDLIDNRITKTINNLTQTPAAHNPTKSSCRCENTKDRQQSTRRAQNTFKSALKISFSRCRLKLPKRSNNTKPVIATKYPGHSFGQKVTATTFAASGASYPIEADRHETITFCTGYGKAGVE